MGLIIREQAEADFEAVHDVVTAAFKTLPVASGTEQFIMDALWRSGAATVALVAEQDGKIVGQAAFSKVTIGGRDAGWHGCGPVGVLPALHKTGIGSALMRAGLQKLRGLGSNGCVVVGDPAYYKRFGFDNSEAMSHAGVPPQYFMAIRFEGELPHGEVKFDKAFEATQ